MSTTTRRKKQLKVMEASASYLVEAQQARHSGESRNPATLVCLPSVAEINPRRFSTQPGDDELVSFIPMKAVEEETGRLDASQMRPWRELKKGYTPFQEGDVIFAKITPCMENGKFALAKGLHNGRAAGSTEFHVFRPGPNLNAEYLLHFLFTPELRSNAKLKMQGAAGQLRVTTNFFDDVEIPLPSLDEQHQIVAEIEKQFTRLEAGIAALRRVQANLKRYRAAVLKAACEGRLVPTEAELARKEGRAYESADKLLARILIERRERWTGRGQYIEPGAPDITALPTLPDGWAWALAEQVCLTVASGSTPAASKMYSGNGEVPFLKVYNLTHVGALDFSVKPTFVGRETHERLLARSKVVPHDVLMNIVGPPLGKVSLVPDIFPEWNINQAIVAFRASSAIQSRLLAYWLLSDNILGRLVRTAKATAGQFNLQVTACRKLALPIP